jgi:hypothetical protein
VCATIVARGLNATIPKSATWELVDHIQGKADCDAILTRFHHATPHHEAELRLGLTGVSGL